MPDDSQRRLILGSSSRFRRKLFIEHCADAASKEAASFLSPDIDEKAIRHKDAKTLTRLIANAKADALVEQLRSEEGTEVDALLICMDQVVCCNDEIREKPEDAAVVRRYLASYQSGLAATCVNGLVVHDVKSGVRRAANEVASVYFAPFPDAVIDDAIAQGRVYDSAGSFAIEDPTFAPFIKSIDGDKEAVIGLPLRSLRETMESVVRAAAAVGSDGTSAEDDNGDSGAFVPSHAVPGLCIRPLQRSEEAAVLELVGKGMRETITKGLRDELLRPTAFTRHFIGAAIAAVGSVLLSTLVPSLSLGAAAGVTVGVLGVIFACAVYLLPRHFASGYVDGHMRDDMARPYAHYMERPNCCFWVAVDEISGDIAGTVAVEQLPPGSEEPSKWAPPPYGRVGDAELRRMSVAHWARGQGIAAALYAELERFCRQCEGTRRICLSTSTLQLVAHDKLYPRLGFEVVHRKAVFGGVKASFFAKELRGGGARE